MLFTIWKLISILVKISKDLDFSHNLKKNQSQNLGKIEIGVVMLEKAQFYINFGKISTFFIILRKSQF